jgi:hypothetical protein
LPNSNPTKLPTKASTEKVSGLATKKLADEGKTVVVNPSEMEHIENNQIGYTSSEESRVAETEVERSVDTSKAREVGLSFTEMIKNLGKKAATKTEEKTMEIKDKSIEAINYNVHKDTRDIHSLGIHVEDLVLVYEKIMFEIEREDYKSQERLLTGYKKLLEEQINVVDSKLNLAKRLKNIPK